MRRLLFKNVPDKLELTALPDGVKKCSCGNNLIQKKVFVYRYIVKESAYTEHCVDIAECNICNKKFMEEKTLREFDDLSLVNIILHDDAKLLSVERITRLAEYEKTAIMRELFPNDGKNMIEVYFSEPKRFKEKRKEKQISDATDMFIYKCEDTLKCVHNIEMIEAFKTFSYEDILNEYLGKKYRIPRLEMQQVVSELGLEEYKKIQEQMEEIKKAEREEQEKREAVQRERAEQRRKEVEKKLERKKIEKEIVSQIAQLKWKEKEETTEAKYQDKSGDKFFGGMTKVYRITYQAQYKDGLIEFKVIKLIEGKINYIFTYKGEKIDKTLYVPEEIYSKIRGERIIQKTIVQPKIEIQKKEVEEKKKVVSSNIKEQKKDKTKSIEPTKIKAYDFMVRGNVFKCRNRQHIVTNIDAVINIIDSYDKEKSVKITAGHCEACNIYFIMESTYQRLKSQGFILCKISDEKTYLEKNYTNGMLLAQESTLMQYGYNVSQVKGLSSTQRKKILALIIDKEVMTKSEIISYLDFFMNQKKYQSKFALAISKWEDDKKFVMEYRVGEYLEVGVKAIYRK